jgi:hypothetical protein
MVKATHSSDVFEFEFLLKWNTFDFETKCKKLTAFFSHELNLFLYFKDPEFFK